MFAPRFPVVLALVLAIPVSASAADLDPYLPTDTQTYASINVKQLLGSSLVKKHGLAPAKEALKDLGDVNKLLDDLGFDPFKDLDRVIISSPGGTDKDRGLFIVHGTFDADKFKKKADAASKDNDESITIHKTPLGNGVTHPIYEIKVPGQELTMFVAVATKQTLLVSPGKDYVVDALKQARTKKAVVLKNKALQGVIEKLDTKQSLSIALLGKSISAALEDYLPQGMKDALDNAEVIGGGVTISNDIKLDVVIANKDEKSAKAIHQTIDKGLRLAIVGLALVSEDNKGLGLLLEVVKTLKVGTKGKQVTLSGKLTADVLDDLFKKDE